jgi:hypothetical protein
MVGADEAACPAASKPTAKNDTIEPTRVTRAAVFPIIISPKNGCEQDRAENLKKACAL